MILVDLNQVMISTLMVQIGFSNKRTSVDLNEHFLRHMVLNTIRSYKQKYGQEYGEMVICCDAATSWRKEFYPFYKAGRQKAREEGGLDWKAIFTVLKKIRQELIDFMPYKVLLIDNMEADDIIATVAIRVAVDTKEPVLILSSDKDFKQLGIVPGIKQFSPRLKALIKEKDPVAFLKEHIIKGDTSDGIPNILSGDDSLITGLGKKNLSKAKLAQWVNEPVATFCTTDVMVRGWHRNETLIDLFKIPEAYKVKILEEFEKPKEKVKPRQILDYFMSRGLRNLISIVDEF